MMHFKFFSYMCFHFGVVSLLHYCCFLSLCNCLQILYIAGINMVHLFDSESLKTIDLHPYCLDSFLFRFGTLSDAEVLAHLRNM